jgi:hypothetical protein
MVLYTFSLFKFSIVIRALFYKILQKYYFDDCLIFQGRHVQNDLCIFYVLIWQKKLTLEHPKNDVHEKFSLMPISIMFRRIYAEEEYEEGRSYKFCLLTGDIKFNGFL